MLAHHLILSPYGRCLPTSPQGSWTHFIGSWELFLATATTSDLRDITAALHHPPIRFTELQIPAIAQAFATRIARSRYTCLACAILPDHIHLCLLDHQVPPRQMARALKQQATEHLIDQHLHPRDTPLWAKNCWDHYLDSPTDIRRTITYIEANLPKHHLPPQPWPFLTPYPVPATQRRAQRLTRLDHP